MNATLRMTFGVFLASLVLPGAPARAASQENEGAGKAKPSVRLEALQWTVADNEEPRNPRKPHLKPASRAPFLGWRLRVEPSSSSPGGGRVSFYRTEVSGEETLAELARTPPMEESWLAEVAPDGRLAALSARMRMGVQQTELTVRTGKGGSQAVFAQNGNTIKRAWPEKATVWPAALAEWLAQGPRKTGALFTRVIADPWMNGRGLFRGKVTGFKQSAKPGGPSEVLLEVTISIERGRAERFSILGHYQAEEAGVPPRLEHLRQEMNLYLNPISGDAFQALRGRVAEEFKRLNLKAADGTDLVEKVRGLLLAKDNEREAIENRLLKEEHGNLLAACRLLLRGQFQQDRQRLLVLAARTGTPAARPFVSECYDTISSTRRIFAMAELGRRGDPRAVDALVRLLAKKEFRTRDRIRQALRLLKRKHSNVQEALSAALMAMLRDPRNWGPERPKDFELDGIIAQLTVAPPEEATQILEPYFLNATIRERGAMIRVAAVAKDDSGLRMIRAMLRDRRGDLLGLRAACHAAGEMEDIRSVPLLIPLLDAKHPLLRKEAHEALMKISGEHYARTPMPWRQWWKRLVARAAKPKGLIRSSTAGRPVERLNALRLLAVLQPPGALQTLEQCLKDENVKIRTVAVRGLGRLGGAESLPLLIRMLDDSSTEVKTTAHKALQRRTGQHLPVASEAWKKWLENMRPKPGQLEQLLRLTK